MRGQKGKGASQKARQKPRGQRDSCSFAIHVINKVLGDEHRKMVTIEKCLIQNMQRISEVESMYKFSEEDEITIYTIISNKRYNRAVNMQVYEVEYKTMEAYPEANIEFHCLPRLGFADQEFLPSEVVKICEQRLS